MTEVGDWHAAAAR